LKEALLLDANISWKLASLLTPLFGDCRHVDSIGLAAPAQDAAIWDYVRKNGYIIITKDNDFVHFLELKSFPPKIVLLKTGNNSSKNIMELLIKQKPMIEDLEKNDYRLLEII
jgi:predicted nuclease of predicted toxin-antitoxin system